jgi:hypothetical protein
VASLILVRAGGKLQMRDSPPSTLRDKLKNFTEIESARANNPLSQLVVRSAKHFAEFVIQHSANFLDDRN